MKNKVCIIITYFGTLPETIDLFMQSCRNNPEFEWLIFTDCEYSNPPLNVHLEKYTFDEIKELIYDKLKIQIVLERPYKLCDYRPAFGIIFEDYLKKYDFWGYGDLDVVYGDLSKFITDNVMNKYDKIYVCGHLSLVKNNEKCNNVYKTETKNSWDYRKVFTDSNSWIFDEYKGINEKLIKNGFKIYSNFDFADIDVTYQRFRRADRKTINHVFFKYPFKRDLPSNYDFQLFIWENGKAYHVYYDKKERLHKDELSYIHYRRKLVCKNEDFSTGMFVISNKGIIKEYGKIDKDTIKKYNKYCGKKIENQEYKKALMNSVITELGKFNLLVVVVRFIKKVIRGNNKWKI